MIHFLHYSKNFANVLKDFSSSFQAGHRDPKLIAPNQSILMYVKFLGDYF